MIFKDRYLPRPGKRRLLCACVLASCAVSAAADESKGRIVALNQDFTQMPVSLSKGEENAAGVRKYFNSVCKSGLTHFLINPNGHNTAYASEVWDPVWHHDDRLTDQTLKQFDNLRVLHENGVDWVRVMIDACREQGVSPWISMRMNDIHNIGDGVNWACSRFWLDHPEYRRKAGKLKGGSFDSELAFDYTHKEVRDHALALVREMLGKWDVDGFEFDWLRFPHHVNDEAELNRTGCAALTDFMRGAKGIVDEFSRKRGKRILVCVRVAAMPEAAVGLGTDAVQWTKEGLVDWVAPCNFFTTADFALPYPEWKAKLTAANPNVRLLGAFDFAGVSRENIWIPQGVTEAEFCGYLERMYAAGVVDFETFNLFNYSESPMCRFVQIDGMRDGERWVRSRDRAYPVTFHDAVPKGFSADRRLPAKLDRPLDLEIGIGRVGDSSAAALLLAFDGAIPSGLKDVVTVNGTAATEIRPLPPKSWMLSIRSAKSSCGVRFPLSAIRDGQNLVRIGQLEDCGVRLLTCELFLRAGTPKGEK